MTVCILVTCMMYRSPWLMRLRILGSDKIILLSKISTTLIKNFWTKMCKNTGKTMVEWGIELSTKLHVQCRHVQYFLVSKSKPCWNKFRVRWNHAKQVLSVFTFKRLSMFNLSLCLFFSWQLTWLSTYYIKSRYNSILTLVLCKVFISWL